jgi:Starter unit:ACP transacylase in aflatoxin biosynthesis
MTQRLQLYLFGDQTFEFDSPLRSLLKSPDAILISFFERSYHALRAEIGLLPLYVREAFPRFSSIADLLSRRQESGLGPSLEKAVATIYQFGFFIASVSIPAPNATYNFSLTFPLDNTPRVEGHILHLRIPFSVAYVPAHLLVPR